MSEEVMENKQNVSEGGEKCQDVHQEKVVDNHIEMGNHDQHETDHKRVILMPLDGSNHSERAFMEYSSNILKEGDYLVIVHIHQPPTLTGLSFNAAPGVFMTDAYVNEVNESLKKSKELAKSFAKRCKSLKIKYKIILKSVEGNGPGETICKLASEVKPTLIVIGSRGLGSVSRFFLGSVSDYVVHHSDFAVCVVPPSN